MKLALVTTTDGRRESCAQTFESARLQLGLAHFAQHIVVNDCFEDPTYQDFLRELLPDAFIVPPALGGRRGFGGAIIEAWSRVDDDVDFVFHLEDDFLFQHAVPLFSMIELLIAEEGLAQVSLMRQPANSEEAAAGGVVAVHPEAFADRVSDGGLRWLEHRLYFTTNPSVYPRWVVERGWPVGSQSEGMFTHGLLAEHPDARFAVLGGRDDEPAVWHIGQRHGEGY